MISWLRRHRQSIFVGTVAVFLIGTFVGLGGYLFVSSDYTEAVAVVGKAKIPYLRYQVRVQQYLDALRESRKGEEVPEATVKEARRGMLRDMIVDELLAMQAERIGLKVSDMELALAIRNSPRFQHDGVFDQGLYFQSVQYALKTTPEDFELQQRRSMASAKLKQLLFAASKVPSSELRGEYLRQKGSDKDFEKERDSFAQSLQQVRALDAINFLLRQMASQMEIRDFLEQREQGT